MIHLNPCSLPEELLPGLQALAPLYGFQLGSEGVLLSAVPGDKIRVDLSEGKATVAFRRRIHFFRGLGLLLEALSRGETAFSACETPQFDTNGAMFDVSQGNAVPRVETVKKLLCRMAVMGLNLLMLYCEDSYTVPEEPYFGYMRARYTEAELRECDDFADALGIEMAPCIQTLSHLTDALKWQAFNDIKEDPDTLFVGGEKTYEFIEHLIRAASAPFRSRRIHIGMDEAWRLGRGRYLTEHGLVPSEKIMQEHLKRVMEIVRRLGLVPMMWSDMFFRAFADGDYYKADIEIPEGAEKLVPPDVSLVYWDYYHLDEEFYHNFIQKHRLFGEPIFAGGIWTWFGYGANWGMTFAATHPALRACKTLGVKEVFATIWGDNGTESDILANLLGLMLFAEHGYAKEFDEEKFRRRFEFCCDACYDDFYALRLLDETPGCAKGNLEQVNPAKYLMWQDLLAGLFDYHIAGLPLEKHYGNLAKVLNRAAKAGPYQDMFAFYAQTAKVLSMKSELGLRITDAYRRGDRTALERQLAAIEALQGEAEELRRRHKAVWFARYKALGWEVMDMRYGSLLIRLRSAAEEIGDYLAGRLPRLEELEEERRSFNGKEGLVRHANWYGRMVSASRIAPEA